MNPGPEAAASGSAGTERDVVVCREEELPPGAMVIAPVGKFGVGVFNLSGSLYAITNYCPHMGAPLCLGNLHGTQVWSNERRRVERVLEGRVLRCPWHSWEFDVATGRAIGDPAKGIRTYAVRVQDGEVILTR